VEGNSEGCACALSSTAMALGVVDAKRRSTCRCRAFTLTG
jgi:hypothetical protein